MFYYIYSFLLVKTNNPEEEGKLDNMDRDEEITGVMLLNGMPYTNGRSSLGGSTQCSFVLIRRLAEFRVQILKDVFMCGCRFSLLMFFIFLVNLEVK